MQPFHCIVVTLSWTPVDSVGDKSWVNGSETESSPSQIRGETETSLSQWKSGLESYNTNSEATLPLLGLLSVKCLSLP